MSFLKQTNKKLVCVDHSRNASQLREKDKKAEETVSLIAGCTWTFVFSKRLDSFHPSAVFLELCHQNNRWALKSSFTSLLPWCSWPSLLNVIQLALYRIKEIKPSSTIVGCQEFLTNNLDNEHQIRSDHREWQPITFTFLDSWTLS